MLRNASHKTFAEKLIISLTGKTVNYKSANCKDFLHSAEAQRVSNLHKSLLVTHQSMETDQNWPGTLHSTRLKQYSLLTIYTGMSLRSTGSIEPVDFRKRHNGTC